MRSVQSLLVKCLLLLLLLASAGVAAWHYPIEPVREGLQRAFQFLPTSPGTQNLAVMAAAALVALVALVGLLPLPASGRNRRITFTTSHGTVTIALGPVYRTLHKLVRKMPEVRACRLDIRLGEDGKSLQVCADVRLNKMPRQPGRDTAKRVSDIIHDAAVGLLGIDQVIAVDLNVRDFTLDINAAAKALRQDHPAVVEEPMNLEGLEVVRMDEVEVPEVNLDAESLEAYEEPVSDMMRVDNLDGLNLGEMPTLSEEEPKEVPAAAPEPAHMDDALPEAEEFDEDEHSFELQAETEADVDHEEKETPPLPPLQFDEDPDTNIREEEKRKDDSSGPWSL
jgi:hypothetical protein